MVMIEVGGVGGDSMEGMGEAAVAAVLLRRP